MTREEAIRRIENHIRIHSKQEQFRAVYITEALEMAVDALKAQEPQYPVCEHCGKQIDRINTSVFNYDGSDSEHQMLLTFDKETGCVVFETTQNWTGYELTDEERKEGIRCPHCGEYPFDKDCEIQFNEPVSVLMWTSSPTDEQKEATPCQEL